MFVICKKCNDKIPVATRPSGSTNTQGTRIQGNVRIEGGSISFGPGGSISFGPGGSLSLGGPVSSPFTCPNCRSRFDYLPEEILDDEL